MSHSKSIVLAISGAVALFGYSGEAQASCAPRVAVTSKSPDKMKAIGEWQARVANTIGDLYSDWAYARKKSVSCTSTSCRASGIPCNTR
jgi:hypothetical protein